MNPAREAIREYVAENGPVHFHEPPMEFEDEYDLDVWGEMAAFVEENDLEYTEDGYVIEGESCAESPEDLQVKEDLEDFARNEKVFDNVGGPDEYHRAAVVRHLLPEATVRSRKLGSYQGTMIFVIEGYGYYWIIKEAYGSCELCDGFIGAPNYGYGLSILRNAYAFEGLEDARAFLSSIDGWGWGSIREPGLGLLDELEDSE